MTNALVRRRSPVSDRVNDTLGRDLTLGLHAVTEFNQSIRYADTKAGALAAVQALVVTVLAARRDGTGSLLSSALLTGCLAAVLISAVLLARGQTPRLRGPRSDRPANRLAFPSLSAMPPADVLQPPSLAVQHEHVWLQASELAAIAMTKYRWLHRAMVSTLVTLGAVLVWFGVNIWITSH
jgi:hypothetical protein